MSMLHNRKQQSNYSKMLIKKKNPNLYDNSAYPDITAHKLVGQMMVEIAAALYEDLVKDNKIYTLIQDQEDFIKREAPRLRLPARQALTEYMVSNRCSEEEEEEIMEALALDQVLSKLNTVTRK